MPRGDGTGPVGMGPMTGRAAGFCDGFGAPRFSNRGGGRGFRGFYGRGAGRGMGRGFRNRYCMPAYPVNMPQAAAQNELGYLKEQAQFLKESLDEINKRVEQIQAESK